MLEMAAAKVEYYTSTSICYEVPIAERQEREREKKVKSRRKQ